MQKNGKLGLPWLQYDDLILLDTGTGVGLFGGSGRDTLKLGGSYLDLTQYSICR